MRGVVVRNPQFALRSQSLQPRHRLLSHQRGFATLIRAPSILPCQPRKLQVLAVTSTGAGTGFGNAKPRASSAPISEIDAEPQWSDSSNFILRQQMLECSTASALQALLQQNGPELGPSDVAAAWHVAVQHRLLTLARSGDASEAALAAHLLYLADQFVDKMDPAALSTTAWALAASDNGSADLMTRVLTVADRTMVGFLPPQLCILLWAAASHPRLEAHCRQIPFTALATLIESGMRLELFSSRDLATLLWSLGRISFQHGTVIDAAEGECARKMHEFTPSDTARAFHGFSMLRHNPLQLRAPLTETWGSKTRLAEFSPGDLTLLMVACGKLGVEPDTKVMRAMLSRANDLVPPTTKADFRRLKIEEVKEEGDDVADDPLESSSGKAGNGKRRKRKQYEMVHLLQPHHMAHWMWALARLDYRPTESFFALRILRHIESNPGQYTGEDLSAILWACIHLNIEVSEDVLVAVALRAIEIAPGETPPTVASIVHSLATFAAKLPAVPIAVKKFAAMAVAVLTPAAAAKKLSSGDLAAAVIALGTLEMVGLPKPVALQLQKSCLLAIKEFSSTELPQISWSLIRLRWTAPQLLDAIASAATLRCGLMSSEALTQMAWSFAAMDRLHAPLASSLAMSCCKKLAKFNYRDKARLAWAFGHLAARHPEAITPRHLHAVLGSISKDDVAKLDSISVSAVMWACGRVARHPGPVLEAVGERVRQHAQHYSKEQVLHARAVFAQHGSKAPF